MNNDEVLSSLDSNSDINDVYSVESESEDEDENNLNTTISNYEDKIVGWSLWTILIAFGCCVLGCGIVAFGLVLFAVGFAMFAIYGIMYFVRTRYIINEQ